MPFIVRLARDAGWAPLCVLVLHEIGARMIGHEPYVDPSMHFLGGAAATFFFRYAFSQPDRWPGPVSAAALDGLSLGVTCVLAIFWEFAEVFVERLVVRQSPFDLADTMSDLALGLCGSLVYLGVRRLRRGPEGGAGYDGLRP